MSPRRILALGALVITLVHGAFILLQKKIENEENMTAWWMIIVTRILLSVLSAKLLIMAI